MLVSSALLDLMIVCAIYCCCQPTSVRLNDVCIHIHTYIRQPGQLLTDLLATAAKALGKDEVQNGVQNPEHMLAILHGLKGKGGRYRGRKTIIHAAACFHRFEWGVVDRDGQALTILFLCRVLRRLVFSCVPLYFLVLFISLAAYSRSANPSDDVSTSIPPSRLT